MTSTPVQRGDRVNVRLEDDRPILCDIVTVFPTGDIVARPVETDGVGILIERDFVDELVTAQ